MYAVSRRDARRSPTHRHPLRQLSLAVAALLVGVTSAQADFSSTGLVTMSPVVPDGPGSAVFPTASLTVGAGGAGSFAATAGSQLRVGQIVLGTASNTSDGTLSLDGVGTSLILARQIADGGSFIGYQGSGTVTVSGGAVLDGRSETGNCLASVTMYCNTFVGTGTGSTGLLTVTGNGSSASFLRSFVVGGVQPFGAAGTTTKGRVEVLAGGRLTTDNATIGAQATRAGDLSQARVTVSGAGSTWQVTGASIASVDPLDDRAAYVSAGGSGSTAQIDLLNGGRLVFGPGTGAYLNLGSNGRADMAVDGAGSQLQFQGTNAEVRVGRRGALDSTLTVRNGGSVGGVGIFSVARDGTSGTLAIDGARVSVDGITTSGNTSFLVGRGAGLGSKGTVTLDNGAQLTVRSSAPAAGVPSVLVLGRDAGTEGQLRASGGSTIGADWVGVGRYRNADGSSSDGGRGSLVLNDSTLTATSVVVGSQGTLAGSGGSIVADNVVLHGLLSPGNSPGTLSIDADFRAEAGSRIVLEVATDGAGGFLTDRLLFATGHALDLTQATIEFRFLGAADPYRFQQAGQFDIDTFLALSLGNGSFGSLAQSAYRGATFAASAESFTIKDFRYTVDTHMASFAAPVPEPSTWAMLLGGLAVVAGALRRRGSRRATPA